MSFPSFRCTAYNNEIQNWSDLGVQATLFDKRRSVCNEELGIAYFEAEVLTQTDYYPFGMMMPDRQWSAVAVGYRYGFNGKESDSETGFQDYGFRIYYPAIGKFLSVDPLAPDYPWYTPYQFAGNKPIWAVDLDGLEEYAYIYRTTKDGYNLFRKVDYTNTEAGVGPLGSGVYVQYISEDGSRFDERFISSDGNSIPSFTADNVNITIFRNLETRLNARLIEKTIENVLVAGGHDRTQVEEDVMILDHPRFAGYFATFRGQTSVNYVSDIPVDFFDPSDSHGSTSSRTFPEFLDSDAALKFYDGAASAADNIPNHIGIVRTSFAAHAVEAIRAFADDDVNINAENAERIKTEIEKQ